MARTADSFSSPAPDTADAIAQAAAEWAVRADRPLSEDERRAFNAWRTADPRHASEYARIRGPWQQLGEVGAVSRLSGIADVVEARAKRRRARRQLVVRSTVFFAAAAALAIAYVGWWRTPGPVAPAVADSAAPAAVRVLTGTARQIVLADGSVAKLNGDSRIDTDFTSAERRVRLAQGEAHFAVVKNPDRPFLVAAGAVTVRAVGTAFDVRLATEVVEVIVTEGKVQLEGPALDRLAPVDRPSLVAGERAVIDISGRAAKPVALSTPTRAELDELLAWKTTRLVFDRTPLDEVVATFNRHNSVRLELGSPALGTRTLTGPILADNLDGLLASLAANADVTAEKRADGVIVLHPAR